MSPRVRWCCTGQTRTTTSARSAATRSRPSAQSIPTARPTGGRWTRSTISPAACRSAHGPLEENKMSTGSDGAGQSGPTMCLSRAGLGIGSTAKELSIAAPNGAGVDFAIDGYAYHLPDDASTASVPAALPIQAADTTCLYLVSVDADLAVSVTKGTEVPNAELTVDSVIGRSVLHWPEPLY